MTPNDLVARTEPGEPVDELPPPGLDAVAFSSQRRGLWGSGEALRIELPAPWPDHVDRVAEALASIPHDGPAGPGRGPIAFGALPYEREAPATLVVPAHLHGRTSDGDRWTTRISGDDVPTIERTAHDVAPRDHPATVVLDGGDVEGWVGAVAQAVGRIRSGELTKVVLARQITVTASAGFDAPTLLRRLRQASPTSFAYSVDGFVGATPELLVSRIGDVVRAQPMAGTLPRSGDPDADARRAGELLGSAKNRAEHQITIDMVLDTLLGWSSFVDAAPAPAVVAAGSVQHLATLVEGRLSEPPASVLELVAALHPTPAVGGYPREAALDLIAELEPDPRGRYAGPVGWVDAAGNGAWAVGLRSASVDGTTARLFAGVGVVADSDPRSELAETQAKFAATLGSITRI